MDRWFGCTCQTHWDPAGNGSARCAVRKSEPHVPANAPARHSDRWLWSGTVRVDVPRDAGSPPSPPCPWREQGALGPGDPVHSHWRRVAVFLDRAYQLSPPALSPDPPPGFASAHCKRPTVPLVITEDHPDPPARWIAQGPEVARSRHAGSLQPTGRTRSGAASHRVLIRSQTSGNAGGFRSTSCQPVGD